MTKFEKFDESDANITKFFGVTSPEAVEATRRVIQKTETEMHIGWGKVLNNEKRREGMLALRAGFEAADLDEEDITLILTGILHLEQGAFRVGFEAAAQATVKILTENHKELQLAADDPGYEERLAAAAKAG